MRFYIVESIRALIFVASVIAVVAAMYAMGG